MALEEGESVSEVQIAFDHVDGHSHDGEDSTKIDFSGYNILDIIDYDRLRDIIVNTVNHSTIRPNCIRVRQELMVRISLCVLMKLRHCLTVLRE